MEEVEDILGNRVTSFVQIPHNCFRLLPWNKLSNGQVLQT